MSEKVNILLKHADGTGELFINFLHFPLSFDGTLSIRLIAFF